MQSSALPLIGHSAALGPALQKSRHRVLSCCVLSNAPLADFGLPKEAAQYGFNAILKPHQTVGLWFGEPNEISKN